MLKHGLGFFTERNRICGRKLEVKRVACGVGLGLGKCGSAERLLEVFGDLSRNDSEVLKTTDWRMKASGRVLLTRGPRVRSGAVGGRRKRREGGGGGGGQGRSYLQCCMDLLASCLSVDLPFPPLLGQRLVRDRDCVCVFSRPVSASVHLYPESSPLNCMY